jgi:hypothetical protein
MSQNNTEISSPTSSKTITLLANFLDALTDKITKMTLQNAMPSFTCATTPAKITVSEELNQTPSVKFDGKNIYIDSKKKLGYITGKIKMPKEDESEFQKWHNEDAMVRNWLLNSFEPVHLGNFVSLPTAKDVWDAIRVKFFDLSNNSQLYELQMRVWSLKQGRTSLENFYNTLYVLWREIDFRRPNEVNSPKDAKKYNEIAQQDRLHIFFGGLDNRLDNVRSEILRMR